MVKPQFSRLIFLHCLPLCTYLPLPEYQLLSGYEDKPVIGNKLLLLQKRRGSSHPRKGKLLNCIW